MSLYLYFFTNFIRYGIEIVAAIIVLRQGMGERRPRFWLKTTLCVLIYVAVCIVMAYPSAIENGSEASLLRTLIYLFMYLIILSWLFLCLKDRPLNLLFYFISGNALRTFVYKIYEAFLVLLGAGGIDPGAFDFGTWQYLVIYYPFLIAIYAASWFVIGKKLAMEEDMAVTLKSLAIYLVIAMLNTALNFVEVWLQDINVVAYVTMLIAGAVFNVLIIFIQMTIINAVRDKADNVILQRLWDNDRKQYEQFKANVDMINMKCHDLRHLLKSADGVVADSKFLGELAQSVAIYDCTVKTGNEALDVVLTDKKLVCEKENIQFTCIADGRLLGNMEVYDIYSLFGNLVENAIEYERTVTDSAKRFISLMLKNDSGMTHIHIENWFEGQLSWKDGLPATSKQDKNYHGFGMKSIKTISEKYGGTLKVFVRDNMFQSDIFLPNDK